MDTTTTPVAQHRHESPDLGAAAARMIRALVDRAADGDTEALEQLAALEQLVPQATQLAGNLMNQYGYSHAELAAVLGISRQASVKRFGALPLDPTPLGLHGYGWVRSWHQKSYSSAAVMRSLVSRLASRRAA